MAGPPRDIADAVDRLSRLLRARAQVSGLNPAQWAALRYLARANALSRTPGAVTGYLGATKGTVSQTLLSLARKGLISRRRDPADARTVRLEVTEEGARLVRRDPLQDVEAAAAALGGEAAVLAGLLAALTGELAELGDDARFGSCASCANARPDGPSLYCVRFDADIAPGDRDLLCAGYMAG
ncbi:MAG: MarR family winged helix-turn-helix transcriptional regulator [Flavobacteriaceae bacterium]